MEKRWMLVTDNYNGITKRAADMLYAEISSLVNYVLSAKLLTEITEAEANEYNLIVVGEATGNDIFEKLMTRESLNIPTFAESYGIYVGEAFTPESQIIAIAGRDSRGVLYGCMDFCNKYLGNVLHRNGDLWDEDFFKFPFARKLNPFKSSSSPSIKTRAIWTWGHVIYDYKNFFLNMARLRLNEVVIWNDYLPLNARDVVEYAHSLGIKLIWGFAWGWGTDCADILHNLDQNSLKKLKADVIETYKNEYAYTDCDGIYFQSFTELHTDMVDEKCIAEVVVDLVNEISAELFNISPDLHIQFGLHATSVKNHTDIISRVDKRIHIVWEDCGAFPFNYYPDAVDDFDTTAELTSKLTKLRGENERFGAVFKGMLKLDWTRFKHFTSSYILGERTNVFTQERLISKNKIWKKIQSDWLKNAEYVRKITELIASGGDEVILQALIEDALFERKIMFPAALYAEILWSPNRPINDMIAEVAGYPCVEFAND